MTDAEIKMTWRGRILAIVIGFVALIVCSELLLRIVMPHWREYYSGWFITSASVPGHGSVALGRAGFQGHFAQNNGDFRVHIAINAFGLRNNDPVAAAQGRIWVVGDSMTFGWGVEQPEMYSTVAADISGLPTYNIASPGTNVCGYQALLARMPRDMRPRAVVIGLVLENDIADYDCAANARSREEAVTAETRLIEWSLVDFKYFLTGKSALYNFFAVSLKRIDLINRSLIAIGLAAQPHISPHAMPPDILDRQTVKTAMELKTLRDQLPPGTPYAVLVMPTRFEIRDNDSAHRSLRLKMIAALSARGIETIDLFAGFAAAGFAPTHFRHDGHWSPEGHRIAGAALARWFAALTPSARPSAN